MADVWEPSFDDEEDSDNEIMNESTTSQSKIVNASSASVSQELEEGEISDDDSDESDAADDTSSNDQKKGKPAQINDDTNTDGKSKVSGGIASSQNQSGKGKEEEDCDMDIDHVSSSASSSDTQKDKKNANQNQNQGNNNTTTNGVEMAILREENQRLLALVSELTKKQNQAAASTDHTLPSTVLQRPLLQVDYQYLSTEARNALDLSFQRPALDRFAPPRRTTDAGMYYQKGNTGRKGSSNAVDAANKPFADRSIPNGRVQYFETFCIDMVGIRNMPDNLHQPTECDAFAIPIYEGPVNQVPFPDAAAEDLFRALGVCFNCGGKHSARECDVPKDKLLIQYNSRLFREHGKKEGSSAPAPTIGGSSGGPSRYYDGSNDDPYVPASSMGHSNGAGTSDGDDGPGESLASEGENESAARLRELLKQGMSKLHERRKESRAASGEAESARAAAEQDDGATELMLDTLSAMADVTAEGPLAKRMRVSGDNDEYDPLNPQMSSGSVDGGNAPLLGAVQAPTSSLLPLATNQYQQYPPNPPAHHQHQHQHQHQHPQQHFRPQPHQQHRHQTFQHHNQHHTQRHNPHHAPAPGNGFHHTPHTQHSQHSHRRQQYNQPPPHLHHNQPYYPQQPQQSQRAPYQSHHDQNRGHHYRR